MNEHGNYLMAEIVKAYLRYDPSFPNAPWQELTKTYEVGKDLRWRNGKLALAFAGNRIDVIMKDGAARLVQVHIDGQPPSALPDAYAFTRVTNYPQSTWPTLLRVQRGAPLLVEDWTLTLTELSADYKQVKFRLSGSRTGVDGAGVSTERFVSRSGRIVIEPGDWNLEYCLQVFKRPISAGFKIEWKVVPQFVDEFITPVSNDATRETVVTLAQGLTNGNHQLELRGDARTPIAAIRVYRPALISAAIGGAVK